MLEWIRYAVWVRGVCVCVMLPSLSNLSQRKLTYCQPVGAKISSWELRDEELNDEQRDRMKGDIDKHTECTFCLEELKEGDAEVLVLVDHVGSCGHSFHWKCLQPYLKILRRQSLPFLCPNCKQPIKDDFVDAYKFGATPSRPLPPRNLEPRGNFSPFWRRMFDDFLGTAVQDA